MDRARLLEVDRTAPKRIGRLNDAHTDLVRRLAAAVGTPDEVDDEPVTGRVQIRW